VTRVAVVDIGTNSTRLLVAEAGGGALEELGAFRVHEDGERLLLNEYAWNRGMNWVTSKYVH